MLDERPVEQEAKDPIVSGSLSWPLAIACLLLLLSTGWAVYDEFVGRRPWKTYQAAFVPAYQRYLQGVQERQRAKEQAIEARADYQRLKAEWIAVSTEVEPQRKALNERLALLGRRAGAISSSLREARSYTAATTYAIETASSETRRERLVTRLDAYHRGPFTVALPGANGASGVHDYDYQQLVDVFNEIQEETNEIRRRLGELVQQEAEKRRAMDAYMAQHLEGPTSDSVGGLVAGLDRFDYGITAHQIHVAEMGLVDRCEVCHLAARSPIPVSIEDLQHVSADIPEDMARAFTSHPPIPLSAGDLLDVHDPEFFGCSTCHGGNGRALISVDEAHGRYKHWLWPMHERQYTEAGCVQCHDSAMHLEGAPTLNRGRYLFSQLGCWGCHPRDPYDSEARALEDVAQQERRLQTLRARLLREIDEIYEGDDLDRDPAPVKQRLSQADASWDQLMVRKAGLQRARKMPGPSLKNIRAKLHPDWLAVWIENPRAFRASTRMPQFDLSREQVQAIAAFLWQSAEEISVASHPPGDPVRGETLFAARGCQVCHGLDDSGSFAADLGRIGETSHYDYLVQWIADPPQESVMPNLRLSEEEVRDVASFLAQHHTGAEYERAEFLTDPSLFDQGKDLVTHYGCFACHEIAGTEGLGKVATDLSSHGSKPIERLDFALLAKQAKRDGWYNHQGFLDAKLADPLRFDEGKIRHDWRERLKMPDFDLSDEDRRALVTFLLGSVDSQLPEAFYHQPTGWAKDIEQGWPVVKKYNCQSCHQIVPEETPDVWALPQYQGEGREMAPPSLVGSGARFEESWLARFLRNPSLHRTEQDRNGARAYLDIRMPTYALSEEEIGQLVRFFNALSEQPSPYPEEKLEPLNEDELADVRALFRAGQCLSCHVTSDDPRTFTSETKAPGYLVSAERLKPDWNRRWLRDPGQIMPGTVMPAFFTEIDGRWRATVLPEDQLRVPEADQVELMVRYQKFFDEAEAEYWAEQAEQ